MAVLVVWYKWKMRNFLIIQLLILCMATLELMAQPENCKEPLGMESGTIRGDQITASSSNYLFPESKPSDYARLHGNSAWVSRTPRYSDPWIQVDFERTLWVTGVATQGADAERSAVAKPQWVTAYYIQYATVGMGWQTIQNDQNLNQIFPGNFDRNTTVRNNFTIPISLRHIRIYAAELESTHQVAVLRFELYGCEASDLTTISPEFKDEGSLKDLIIVGVAVGSFVILLLGVVELIRYRKRVCKRDKADARQHPSTKDTNMTEMQDKSDKSGKGSEQATYEEPRKSQITNDANSEKVPDNLDESDQTYDEIKETNQRE